MKEQHGNPAHAPNMQRSRKWDIDYVLPGMNVILARNIAILTPNEDLTEFPPTFEFDNWRDFENNAGSFGIDVEDYRERLER